ncbi:MAG: outer membrane beta-barrel family protein [Ignavibacteria bacterium]
MKTNFLKAALLILCIFNLPGISRSEIIHKKYSGYKIENGKDTINGRIKGSIIDKDNNTPLASVTIQLLNIKDNSLVSGTETATDGKFTLENIPFGTYNLKIGLIGYSNAIVKDILLNKEKNVLDLEPVKLKSGLVSTEEIVVEAEKSAIELKPDKKVFNVDGNMITQGGSAIDILKNVPSVSVDVDGNVSFRGNQNVKIIVDGKPFGGQGANIGSLLEQIPANQISSVELITNPSAKFEAEGPSGIINIVLKKGEGFGYNGSLSLNAGTNDKYNGTLNFNMRNNKLRFNGSYDYRLYNFLIEGTSNRENFISFSRAFLNQQTAGRMRNTNHFGKGGIDYNIDDRNSLSLSGTYTDRDRQRNETIQSRQFDANNNLNENYYIKTNEKTIGHNFDLGLNYSLKFKNPKQSLTSDITYFNTKDNTLGLTDRIYVLTNSNEPLKQTQLNLENNYETNLQADYTHPISENTKLEAGYKSIFRKTDKDFTTETFDNITNGYILDPSLSNRFIYKEQIHGAYAMFGGTIKKFNYQFGLRAEQTNSNGDLVTTNRKFDNDYFGLFPSASLSQKLGAEEELQLSYSRRITRPSLNQLNPFINTSDPLNYFSGNPDLKPEYINSFEFGFAKYFTTTTINPSIFYRESKNQLSRTRTLIDTNVTLTSFTNYGSSKTYGAELIVNTTLFQFWNLNASGSYFNTDVNAENVQQGFTNDGFAWSGRINSSMKIPGVLDIILSYFYSGKLIVAQGELSPFQSFDLSLRKDFLEGQASIGLRVSDVFNNLKFQVLLDGEQFKENFFRKRDTRSAFLSFTYKFGQGDKNDDRKRKRDRGPDQNQNDGMGF